MRSSIARENTIGNEKIVPGRWSRNYPEGNIIFPPARFAVYRLWAGWIDMTFPTFPEVFQKGERKHRCRNWSAGVEKSVNSWVACMTAATRSNPIPVSTCFACKGREVAVSVRIELNEDQVPYFDAKMGVLH